MQLLWIEGEGEGRRGHSGRSLTMRSCWCWIRTQSFSSPPSFLSFFFFSSLACWVPTRQSPLGLVRIPAADVHQSPTRIKDCQVRVDSQLGDFLINAYITTSILNFIYKKNHENMPQTS